MTKKKHRKKKKIPDPDTNTQLPGFDIKINSFGEIQSTYDIDTVNTFLNKNLEDKKLKNKIEKRDEDDREEENNKK
jgi:hypothetical protein